MHYLTRWIPFLPFPGFNMGGGKGDGGAAQREAEEEKRKDALRKRIDSLYGIGRTDARPAPVYNTPAGLGRLMQRAVNEQVPVEQAKYDADQSTSAAARDSMEGENTKLGEATRGYYTDALGRDYAKAERETRFKLARQGLLGGSEDVNQQGQVKTDRDLGATRVDEAVARAVAQLKTQREGERANAVALVNSGAGESAVSAAQAGLHNSFDNAASAQKADIFTDLFANTADVATADNLASQQAMLANRYRDRLSTFFPSKSTSGGRVTPSA